MDGADVDEGAQAVAEFGQGGVGLLGDQDEQLPALAVAQLARGAAAVGLGGDRAGLAAALEQLADPGFANAEEFGELRAGAAALVAGAGDALAEVLGVRSHGFIPFRTPILRWAVKATAKRSKKKKR